MYKVLACKLITFNQNGKHVWSDWTVISTHTTERAALTRLNKACGKGKLGGYSMAKMEVSL